MFICSFKPRDLMKRLGLVSFLVLVTVLAILYLKQPNKRLPFPASGLSEEHNTHAADNAARIAFLSGFGWEVSSEPLECVSVIIPQQFGDVYRNYNELQTAQGFDLMRHRGKQVTRYTYTVTNYPQRPDGVQLNLYICEDLPVAGDVVCTGTDGFQDTLVFPQQTDAS